jgi:hypothetical protein
MGTSCGPSVANLYLQYYEIKYKHLLTNTIYFRFIDDLLFEKDSLLTEFKTIFPKLTLTTNTGSIVQFLDINLSFNPDYSFNFDLYIKPTHTFSYLRTNSNHTRHIFKGIIITLILRIRRICSNISQYYYHCNLLLMRLIQKGYNPSLIQNIIRSYSKVERKSLLNYKVRNNDMNNSILFINLFDKKLFDSSHYFLNLWNNSLPSNSFLKKFLFKIVYKNDFNLNNYFIQNFSLSYFSYSYTKCISDSCKICSIANTSSYIFNNNNLPILIPSKSSCNSLNIIYLIYCDKCSKIYIGQSGRTVKIRIAEHINKIKYFSKIKSNSSLFNSQLSKTKDSEILYRHFNSNGCTLNNFKFQVFISNIVNYRLRLESDLMYIFNTVYPFGLNTQTIEYTYYCETYKKLK